MRLNKHCILLIFFTLWKNLIKIFIVCVVFRLILLFWKLTLIHTPSRFSFYRSLIKSTLCLNIYSSKCFITRNFTRKTLGTVVLFCGLLYQIFMWFIYTVDNWFCVFMHNLSISLFSLLVFTVFFFCEWEIDWNSDVGTSNLEHQKMLFDVFLRNQN